ncbi:hypothetical protein CLAIMM_05642, partial [Cladophialophora immunda]
NPLSDISGFGSEYISLHPSLTDNGKRVRLATSKRMHDCTMLLPRYRHPSDEASSTDVIKSWQGPDRLASEPPQPCGSYMMRALGMRQSRYLHCRFVCSESSASTYEMRSPDMKKRKESP